MTILGILASSSAAWTPATLTGLKAWYDAADTATISVTGSSVTQWNDKSTNAYNVTQGTGAKQPQSGTTTLNSKNVIAFDGGDRLVAATAANWKFLHDGTNCLLGIVVKWSSSSDPNQAFTALATNSLDDTTFTGAGFGMEDRAAASLNNALRTSITKGSAGQYVALSDSNNAITPNSAQVLTYLTDADNGTAADRIAAYVGTGSALKNNAASNAVSTSNPSYALNIGWNENETYSGITGYIAEVVIASGADATDTNRVLLRNYLAAKWGL